MTWQRATNPSRRARYSFTVNLEKHPELANLATFLWNLPPVTTERNQAITELLQAGFESTHPALARQAGDQAAAPAPQTTALATPPKAKTARRSSRAPAKPKALPSPPPESSAANSSPPAAPDAGVPGFSSATSRFLHQFDDEAPGSSLVVS